MDDAIITARLAEEVIEFGDAIVANLAGLSDHDIRRPLVPSGTNLLGLVKHVAIWESRYLGLVFDRPFPGPVPAWDDPEARGTDLLASESESSQDVLDLLAQVRAHSAATVTTLELGSPGFVPWWPRPEVTLLDVLLHLITENARHAGHADILREQLDATTGAG